MTQRQPMQVRFLVVRLLSRAGFVWSCEVVCM